jgi:hypothetical protein
LFGALREIQYLILGARSEQVKKAVDSQQLTVESKKHLDEHGGRISTVGR